MSSRASVVAHAKQAALLTLLLWACSESTTDPLGSASAGGAGGEAGDPPSFGGESGETAGQAGQLSALGGKSGSSSDGGDAGTQEHPHHPARGGSAGTSSAAGEAGQAGEAGTGGEAGAYSLPPCTIVAPTACPDPMPTYADVEPIFSERCVVCHKGSADGPWPLTNYGHVASWTDDIRAMLLTCAMPPPEEQTPLPNDESLLVLTWIRCGLPP